MSNSDLCAAILEALRDGKCHTADTLAHAALGDPMRGQEVRAAIAELGDAVETLPADDSRNYKRYRLAVDVISAEIGTTGETGSVSLTGDAARDIGAAAETEHYCNDACCDISRALSDGYPLWAASLLQGATECPLVDAVVSHYCGCGLDFGAESERERDEWLQTETWKSHAYECDACGSITFGDASWTPSECANCGSDGLTPARVSRYDVDDFLAGYLDGILFTEPAAGYGDGESDTSFLDEGFSRADFSADAVAEIRAECVDFIAANLEDLERYAELRGDPVRCNPDSFGRSEYSAAECAGTDFWLSRNRHGAGYFDRGVDPVFTRLQDAARVYGSAGVYLDGGKIVAGY